MRWCLLQLDESEHWLCVALHHIVTDGVSTVLFLRQLGICYGAFARGQTPRLPPLPVQYADYAGWQRRRLQGEGLDNLLAYWRRQLAGAPAILPLPTDRPRPAHRDGRGREATLDLQMDLVEALGELGRRVGATFFLSLLTIFEILLARLSGQTDLVVGTPVAGRDRREIESLIGFFVNNLVLRADLSGAPSALDILGRLRTTALEAYAHQELPFERLVEALRPARDLGHAPVFQVLFGVEGNAGVDPRAVDIPGLEGRLIDLERRATHYDLSFTVQGSPGGFRLVAEYPTDLFDGATIERWLGHFRTLLDRVVAAPDTPWDRLDILTRTERRQIVEGWNATAVAAVPELVPRRLARCAAEYSDAPALVVTRGPETVELSYATLRRRVVALAAELRRRGIGHEDRVALCLERGPWLVIGLLAVLETGGAYVPLDPEHPAERRQHVLGDAGVSLLIAEEANLDDTEAEKSPAVPVLRIDRLGPCSEESERTDELLDEGPRLDPANLAYVLYTSGSTGRPKGVEICHGALANFVASMAERPGLEAGETLLAVTTPSFDIHVVELILPLVLGARVVLADAAEAADGRRLAARLEASGAEVMQATPATWRQLLDAGWSGRPGLRALCGGEALPVELARRLLSTEARLWNLYGPTETTVWSSIGPVLPATVDHITLGTPIAATETHVLDRSLRPVPLGVAGELYIGGAGLARGYHGLAGLTGERFVPDPFADRPGARLYKTGDRCRRLASGELDYLGRLDAQVKVRGFRIELGEVESVLLAQPAVRAAAVRVWERRAGEGRLVGYVVLEPGEPVGEDGASVWRALERALEQRLPTYMVPRQWLALDTLPLNPNGKIDRRALPDPAAVSQQRPRLAPRTAVERELVDLWRQLLGEEPGVEDNFFELGGHSLAATRLLSAVHRHFGVEVTIREFFEAPRIDALAVTIERRRSIEATPVADGTAAADPSPGPSKIQRVRRGTGNLTQLMRRVERW